MRSFDILSHTMAKTKFSIVQMDFAYFYRTNDSLASEFSPEKLEGYHQFFVEN